MRLTGTMATATLVAAGMILGCYAIFPAQAAPEDAALNGTYRATSAGTYAQLNHQLHDMETVTSTWTITTTCFSRLECTGTVTTDQGWGAPIKLNFGQWLVVHEIENWLRCPDGTGNAFPGHQHYKFARPSDPNKLLGEDDPNTLKGHDEIKGPSGACGYNMVMYVDRPFTLVKIG